MNHLERKRGLGRRKACDFCCQKRTKCDAKKPRCSGCSMHNVDCAWTPGFNPKTKSARLIVNPNDQRFSKIEDRLRIIEARIQLSSTPGIETYPSLNERSPEASSRTATLSLADDPKTLDSNPTIQLDEADRFPLPLRSAIEPLVESYFRDFHQAWPIFRHDDFMQMFEDWYQFPSQREPASWSAINIVIALSLRHSVFGEVKLASASIGNAQSAMDSLVYRDRDLKGLQVLLGLALFFLGTSHPHPSCVLIATAVKLAHRLKLHLNLERDNTDAQTRKHRNQLFWITYIIDRQMSILTHEPYLLQDDNIAINLSSCLALDNMDTPGGVIPIVSNKQVNFLQLRVKLAYYQGKIYDQVYSVKASNLSPYQKLQSIEHLDKLLEDWYSSIPDCFTLDKVVMLEPSTLRHCISLHMASFQCLFSIHQVNVRDSAWIKLLTEFTASKEFGRRSDLDFIHGLKSAFSPPDWLALVFAARSCLELLNVIDINDSALRWSTTCASQASITIFIANNLIQSVEPGVNWCQIDLDIRRIDEAMAELKRRFFTGVSTDPDGILREMYSCCWDLGTRAATVLDRLRGDSGLQTPIN